MAFFLLLGFRGFQVAPWAFPFRERSDDSRTWIQVFIQGYKAPVLGDPQKSPNLRNYLAKLVTQPVFKRLLGSQQIFIGRKFIKWTNTFMKHGPKWLSKPNVRWWARGVFHHLIIKVFRFHETILRRWARIPREGKAGGCTRLQAKTEPNMPLVLSVSCFDSWNSFDLISLRKGRSIKHEYMSR